MNIIELTQFYKSPEQHNADLRSAREDTARLLAADVKAQAKIFTDFLEAAKDRAVGLADISDEVNLISDYLSDIVGLIERAA